MLTSTEKVMKSYSSKNYAKHFLNYEWTFGDSEHLKHKISLSVVANRNLLCNMLHGKTNVFEMVTS